MSYSVPKHMPHSYAHARPWDQFNGKTVGRKAISLKDVHRPGHKKNAALGELDLDDCYSASSGVYGAFLGGPGRAPAAVTSRKNFGSWACTDEQQHRDVLGPVDLSRERPGAQQQNLPIGGGRSSASKQAEPEDTLRWNGTNQQGLAAARRRRQAQAEAEAIVSQRQPSSSGGEGGAPPLPSGAAAAARRSASERVPTDTLRDVPRARSEKALRHEEQLRVRERLERERMESAAAAASAREASLGLDLPMGALPHKTRSVLANPERVAALTDPRVTAALTHKLKAPNSVAYQQNLTRNTTRLSAERRY
jgi:hypothetical protein